MPDVDRISHNLGATHFFTVTPAQHTLAAAALLTALDTALERLEDAREEGGVVLHLGHHPAERRVLVGVPG